jgi:NAD(P)-dependent dehydrogenase (short-subunit alcohol dehydrogenase family)
MTTTTTVMPTRDVTIGDTFVRISGQGFPLVFVHGFTTTSEFWREQAEEFSKAYRVIRINLPGHRASIIADVTTKEGRDAILATCPAPDILVNNAGGPPPGDFRKFEREDWIKALDANMLAPIALIKATLDGMIARKFGRIVNVTSHAVKAPVAMLAPSNGARTGLTDFVAGLARSTAEHNVTINNLLPGTFDTDRLKSNLAALA